MVQVKNATSHIRICGSSVCREKPKWPLSWHVPYQISSPTSRWCFGLLCTYAARYLKGCASRSMTSCFLCGLSIAAQGHDSRGFTLTSCNSARSYSLHTESLVSWTSFDPPELKKTAQPILVIIHLSRTVYLVLVYVVLLVELRSCVPVLPRRSKT